MPINLAPLLTPISPSRESLAGITIICFWLWSVRGARVLQQVRLTGLVPLERGRRRAAVTAYGFAFCSCLLMSFTLGDDAIRVLALLSVVAPFAQSWLDPDRMGLLHHRRLRTIAIVGHIVLAAAIAFFTSLPQATPAVMAALVFHRYHRSTLRRFVESLREQDSLRAKLEEQSISTQLYSAFTRTATSASRHVRGNDLESRADAS